MEEVIRKIERIISLSGMTNHAGTAHITKSANGWYTLDGGVNVGRFDFAPGLTEDGPKAIWVVPSHSSQAIEFDSRFASYLWFAAWQFEESRARTGANV